MTTLLGLAALWGSVCFGDAGFGLLEFFGPGNSVYRATALEPGSSTQFISVGRSWTGSQYQSVLGGYLKASGRPDENFVTNALQRGKIFKDFAAAGYDNLCTAVATDGATYYYTACRTMKANGYYDVRVWKHDNTGAVDTGFGTNGLLKTGIGGDSTLGHAFVRGIYYNSGASEIVVVGAVGFYSPGHFRPYIARFDTSTGAAKTVTPTGNTSSGSATLSGISSMTGFVVGRVVTGPVRHLHYGSRRRHGDTLPKRHGHEYRNHRHG
jgi:hypothetical protein